MRRRRRSRKSMDDYSDYYEEEVPLQERRKKKPRDPNAGLSLPPAMVHLMILASVGLVLLGLVWMTAGGPVLEKTLQALVAPAGLVWMGLFTVTYFCLLNRQGFPAFLSFACWMLLTISGNSLIAAWMIGSLQNPYVDFQLESLKPLDVVAVLGGGQTTTPAGEPQISDAGDRALMAWRLLRENKTQRIICAGNSSLPLAEGELAQADALEKILLSLGVSEGKVLKIGGRNTLQEIQALDKWITQNNGGRLRLGIVTSAWHLPRAMRLAKSVGIKAEPIPADFSNTRVGQSPNLLIPSSENLHHTTLAAKEYLAGLFGR